jgi:hypothetical protein
LATFLAWNALAKWITLWQRWNRSRRCRLTGVPASAGKTPLGDGEQIEYFPGEVAGGSSLDVLADHDLRVG